MLPHDGAGGCWPKPRNERLASAMMAAATVMLTCTKSGGSVFGRMWRTATRGREQPNACAASTYSSVLMASTVPRTSRTKVGRAAIPIAIMALPRPGPRKAASAMATMRNGIESMASLIRIISPSTQPPR